MKALHLKTIRGEFTFLAHGWSEFGEVVYGCYPTGERGRYKIDYFKPFDHEELTKIHNQNFSM